MNRRAFLRALGFGTVAAAAAATFDLDLEKLLWVPGEKTIFVPEVVAPLVYHGNSFITPDWVTREVLESLENALRLSDYFVVPAVGETVNMRLPQRFR